MFCTTFRQDVHYLNYLLVTTFEVNSGALERSPCMSPNLHPRDCSFLMIYGVLEKNKNSQIIHFASFCTELVFYWRREGDSNPRSRYRRTTVFETAAFDRSAISPKVRQK